jgi:hypothetical protein
VRTEVLATPDRRAALRAAAGDHEWWVRIGSKSHWVSDTATLRSWVGDGRLGRSDLVWDPDTSQWIGSTDVKELRSQFYPLEPIQTR